MQFTMVAMCKVHFVGVRTREERKNVDYYNNESFDDLVLVVSRDVYFHVASGACKSAV